MTNQKHIIKRQLIEMELPRQQDARQWQDYFADLYKKEVLPLIDEYCSAVSTFDEIISIDSLEINVGEIDSENPQAFVDKVKEKLQEVLFRKCDQARKGTASNAKRLRLKPNSNSRDHSSNSKKETPVSFNRKQNSVAEKSKRKRTSENQKDHLLKDQNKTKNQYHRQTNDEYQDKIIRQPQDGHPSQYDDRPPGQYQRRQTEVLFYFIKNGALPWWNQDNTISSQKLFNQLENAAPEYLQLFKPLLKYPACRKRILHGLSPQGRKEFTISIFPHAEEFINQLGSFFKEWQEKYFTNRQETKPFEKLEKKEHIDFFERIILLFLEPKTPQAIADVFTQISIALIRETASNLPVNLTELVSKIIAIYQEMKLDFRDAGFEETLSKEFGLLPENKNKNKNKREPTQEKGIKSTQGIEINPKRDFEKEANKHTEKGSIKETKPTVRNDANHQSKSIFKSQNGPDLKPENETPKNSRASLTQVSQNGPGVPSTSKNTPDLKITEQEEWQVENAGLVLCWCYLQFFFQGLGLMKDGEFIDEASQWKAIHLLHFLAIGESVEEEGDLILNKIICGLSPEDFVPDDLSLSEQEKEECEHLLQVMIDNWKVLKKTPIRGLRNTFLQRPGILSKDHQGWVLKIERQTMDILLDRLPWTISLIKLPWNEKIIQVAW